jgi:hypothetical protein
MAYRNIAYNKQKDNTKKKKNKKKIPSGIIDQTMAPKSNRPGKKKKKYTGTFKTRQPGIEAANIRPRELSFGATFKKHKAAGDKEFTWKGKKFHTKTKEELETGKSEKERFEKAAKSKKVPDNQSNWNKFKDSKTLAEFFRKIKK